MAKPIPIVVTPEMEAVFWQRVDRREPHECWEWIGGNNSKGYGRFFTRDRRGIAAHRVSMAIAGQLRQDDNLVVDHICRNRKCVNPGHLRMLSPSENVLIGIGVTAQNARKRACKLGHPLEGENLAYSQGTRQCRACRNRRQNESRRKQRECRNPGGPPPSAS